MMGVVPERRADGTLIYPSLKEILEVAGLHMIKTYIKVRRQTIESFILNRPIFNLCQRGKSEETRL